MTGEEAKSLLKKGKKVTNKRFLDIIVDKYHIEVEMECDIDEYFNDPGCPKDGWEIIES